MIIIQIKLYFIKPKSFIVYCLTLIFIIGLKEKQKVETEKKKNFFIRCNNTHKTPFDQIISYICFVTYKIVH